MGGRVAWVGGRVAWVGGVGGWRGWAGGRCAARVGEPPAPWVQAWVSAAHQVLGRPPSPRSPLTARSQHIFVDPAAPASNYRLTYNCVGVADNQRSFNDGYHIVHHTNSQVQAGGWGRRRGSRRGARCTRACTQRPANGLGLTPAPTPPHPPSHPPGAQLHWSELPTQFLAPGSLERHAAEGALVFQGISFFEVSSSAVGRGSSCSHVGRTPPTPPARPPSRHAHTRTPTPTHARPHTPAQVGAAVLLGQYAYLVRHMPRYSKALAALSDAELEGLLRARLAPIKR